MVIYRNPDNCKCNNTADIGRVEYVNRDVRGVDALKEVRQAKGEIRIRVARVLRDAKSLGWAHGIRAGGREVAVAPTVETGRAETYAQAGNY